MQPKHHNGCWSASIYIQESKRKFPRTNTDSKGRRGLGTLANLSGSKARSQLPSARFVRKHRGQSASRLNARPPGPLRPGFTS